MKSIHAHIALLIISLLAVSSVGVLYFYMYRAVGFSTNRARAAVSLVKAQHSSSIEQKNLEDMYGKTKDDRARLETFFIRSSSEIDFIEALEKVGAQSGAKVSISNVSADDPTNSKNDKPIYINAHMEANGPWSNVMRALSLSEVLPFLSNVKNVRLNMVGSADIQQSNGKKTTPPAKEQNWHLSLDVSANLLRDSSTTDADK